MKILYVAVAMRGITDILQGKADDRGLPAFVEPLKRLKQKKYDVGLILISSDNISPDIRVDWLKKNDIVSIVCNNLKTSRGIKKIINTAKSFCQLYQVISNELKSGDYDFVYCHGAAAFVGNYLANRYRIPCGYRVYGTFRLFNQLEFQGKVKTAIKYPKDFLSFVLKKKFVLVTNDGTRGNEVIERLRLNRRYPIYHWYSGVNKTNNWEESNQEIPNDLFLFTAARITKIKGQHLVIEILNKLHENGHKLHLYIAGPVDDSEQPYLEYLKQKVKDFSLAEYVHFMGDLPRCDMQKMASKSLATLLFSDISNLGNVFFECGMAGAIIITRDDYCMRDFIENEYSGFLVSEYMQAVSVVERLLGLSEQEILEIKSAIRNSIDCKMVTWEERCDREIALITNENK